MSDWTDFLLLSDKIFSENNNKIKKQAKKELIYSLVPQYEQKTADSFTFAVPQLGQ